MPRRFNVRDNFAYDLANDIVNEGEVYDVKVLNQSILNIISYFKKYNDSIFNHRSIESKASFFIFH